MRSGISLKCSVLIVIIINPRSLCFSGEIMCARGTYSLFKALTLNRTFCAFPYVDCVVAHVSGVS